MEFPSQGIVGLISRMGMDVVLAHLEGFELMRDVEKIERSAIYEPKLAFSSKREANNA